MKKFLAILQSDVWVANSAKDNFSKSKTMTLLFTLHNHVDIFMKKIWKSRFYGISEVVSLLEFIIDLEEKISSHLLNAIGIPDPTGITYSRAGILLIKNIIANKLYGCPLY